VPSMFRYKQVLLSTVFFLAKNSGMSLLKRGPEQVSRGDHIKEGGKESRQHVWSKDPKVN
jgi:hypothetical protein